MLIQILISLFLSAWLLPAQTGHGKDIQKIISLLPAGTHFSMSVFDADRKQILFEKNAAAPLKPASNIKLFTTGIPLIYFGSSYQIKTSVYFGRDKIKGKELDGALYIKGFGNALFSTDGIEYLVSRIEKTGIKTIKGGIIYDNSFFKKRISARTVTSSLSPLDVPTVTPLSINRNRIEVTVNGSGKGARITSRPSSKYISIINNCSSTGTGKGLNALLKEGESEYKIIINSLPASRTEQKIYFFVKSPEHLSALLLKEKLENRGIKVWRGTVEGTVPAAGTTEISSFTSLADFIGETNKKSNNFLADELKSIFDRQFTAGDKTAPGEAPEISFLKTLGIQTDGLVFKDGSGISSGNRITSQALSDLLRLIYNKPELYTTFRQSLSIAGVDGTMKDKFTNSPVRNNFYGKTGFMAGTSSISGYMRTKSGTNVIVTILINYGQNGVEYYERIEKEILELIYNKN